MEWLSADFLKALSAPALLLLFFLIIVLAFIMGWVRPRSAVTEIREDRDARLAEVKAERDTWREAHRISEQARELGAEATREQIEVSRAAVDALNGFRSAARWLEQERGDPS